MNEPLKKEFLGAFDAFSDSLYKHAAFRVSDRERASDLVQDTFMKAWDYIGEGKEVKQWKAFLYHILNNLIIDSYRKKKEASLDALLEDAPAYTENLLRTGGRDETEAILDTELLIKEVRSHITKLPESYRTAITLRYVDGFSPKEIAQVLRVSENVASVRVHRGLTQLRKLCRKSGLS